MVSTILSNSDFAALGDVDLLAFLWLLFRAGHIGCIVKTKRHKLKAEIIIILSPKSEFSCI